METLTDQIRVEMNPEKERNSAPSSKLLGEDFPYIRLWFTDVVSSHSRAIGDYDFLVTLDPSSD